MTPLSHARNLVEIGALALYKQDPWLFGQDGDGEDIFKPWEEAPTSVRDHYRDGAQAVLEAVALIEPGMPRATGEATTRETPRDTDRRPHSAPTTEESE